MRLSKYLPAGPQPLQAERDLGHSAANMSLLRAKAWVSVLAMPPAAEAAAAAAGSVLILESVFFFA